jgi:ribosomal protein S6--L-glutamate ligase
VGQSLLFEDYGFSQPRTLRWHTVDALKSACPGFEALPHEMPFLIKADRAHEAEGIYLIDRREALSAALDQIRERESSGQAGFVSQDYVSSEGNALRAVIIGDRILTYWKRPREPHTRIATISRGAEIDPAWRPDLQEKGREAAKRLAVRTRINLAAVDFVFPLNQKEPTPLFLEINYFFARRGLGGNEAYYGMVHEAIRTWLKRHGLDPESVKRV